MSLAIDELQKIFNCLYKNGYEFIDVFHASGDHGFYQDFIQARFEKDELTVYQNGGTENDSLIRVNVEFDYRVDEENTLEEEIEEDDDEYEYNIGYPFRLGTALDFVEKLYSDIHDVPDLNDEPDVNGGGKKRRRRRKTRKNKKR
jgi:hypothetical protein